MPVWRCPDCAASFGGPLSGCPRCRSTKGLVMAVNVCAGCTTKFAVGLARCPHCRSTDFQEDGVMPKITRHGGPSVAGATIAEAQWGDGDDEQEASPAADEETAPEQEGGEESSPGSNSETSSETPSSEPEPSETPTPSRARKTASRSKKATTESPSADSAAGDPADGTSATDEEA